MNVSVMKKMFDNPAPKVGIPESRNIPRRTTGRIPCSPEDTQAHLQKYLSLIKNKGADDARIVKAQDIPQDPRVLLKCTHPKCPGYGLSGSCPPHCSGNFQRAKEYLQAYTWAIFFRINIPNDGRKYVSGPESLESYKTKEGRHRLVGHGRSGACWSSTTVCNRSWFIGPTESYCCGVLGSSYLELSTVRSTENQTAG